MGLSGLRWALALAVAVVALVATFQATGTYLAHQLTVGVLAVAALAVTLVAGLASLAWARRRIGAELTGLGSSPPRGQLMAARRRRLMTIKAAGVRPHQDTLADAAAAEQAGRAYIGRYLVATTVLVGLVGTFAGLMETLGKVTPLLGQKDADVLTLLGGPLGGLHVTFGASLVAILATLALALAQGDLALHEQQALALLEDRTRHELVPELWPPEDEPVERTARALTDLRSDLAKVLGAAIADTLEKSGRRMADSARSEGERAARALEATAAAVEKQMARLSAAVETAIAEGTRRQSAALTEATAAALRESSRQGEESARRSASVAEAAVRATSAELGRTLAPMFAEESAQLQAVRAALAEGAGALASTAAQVEAIGGQIEEISRAQVETLQATAAAVVAGFDKAVLGGASALDGAAGQLAGAATDLRGGTEALVPRMDVLSKELGALAREVALLAGRGADGDLGAVVLGELERLGAGFDQLSELVRLARGVPATPAPGDGGADGDVKTAAQDPELAPELAGESDATATANGDSDELPMNEEAPVSRGERGPEEVPS
jgi:hypothetical protein